MLPSPPKAGKSAFQPYCQAAARPSQCLQNLGLTADCSPQPSLGWLCALPPPAFSPLVRIPNPSLHHLTECRSPQAISRRRGQCRRSAWGAPRFCTVCTESRILANPPALQQLAMGPSSWVGQKVVHCRCFAWPRLLRPIPPRSSTAADLNNPVFQEQRAAWVSQNKVDPPNHPHPISLGDHGHRSYRTLRSGKSGFSN